MRETICEHLADLALAAYFELKEMIMMSASPEDLPTLREFLKATTAARVQNPDRMKRLDKLFDDSMHFGLSSHEDILCNVLDAKKRSPMGDTALLRHAHNLHEIAAGLYAIHRKVFSEAEQAYEKATAI